MSALSGSSNHALERRRGGEGAEFMQNIRSQGQNKANQSRRLCSHIYSDKLPQRPDLGKIVAVKHSPDENMTGLIAPRRGFMGRHVYFATCWLASLRPVGRVHRPRECWVRRVGAMNVEIYTLTNAHGVEARIMTYGATLVSLKTPDRAGSSRTSCWASTPWSPMWPACPITARRSAATPIASPRDDSHWTARTTSCHGTTDPTACTVASAASTSGSGRRSRSRLPRGPSLRLSYVSAAGEEGYPGELTCARDLPAGRR